MTLHLSFGRMFILQMWLKKSRRQRALHVVGMTRNYTTMFVCCALSRGTHV